MTTITFLSPGGEPIAVVQAKPGESVMRAALRANVKGIEAECGGLMTCATCHVYLGAGQLALLPPPSVDERFMLDFAAAERREGSRLSCQLVPGTDLPALLVELPERQY
jgi:2Fe-2S ferredoxin